MPQKKQNPGGANLNTVVVESGTRSRDGSRVLAMVTLVALTVAETEP